MNQIQEALELCDKYLGCGDNSCLFIKPRGMATNGGCRCADRPFVMAALSRLYKAARCTCEPATHPNGPYLDPKCPEHGHVETSLEKDFTDIGMTQTRPGTWEFPAETSRCTQPKEKCADPKCSEHGASRPGQGAHAMRPAVEMANEAIRKETEAQCTCNEYHFRESVPLSDPECPEHGKVEPAGTGEKR